MVSGTRAAHNVEITAESLQEDLARLEVQKQALERELAAVVAHLGSVQRALSALQVLMLSPAGATDPAGPAAAPPLAERPRAAEAATADTDASVEGGGTAVSRTGSRFEQPAPRQRTAQQRTSRAPRAEDGGLGSYGRLTEQILEYFASVGDADVRARDVAAALGRDADSGSINAVRSTLDRLVGTSRIRRAGRGLYRAR
ncbi:hypothetical protein ACIQFU_08925 [Streptomyces sp. NPDC093065]|uniref:hypothetical protein n=1 Tax=Streptomyces sp. NPDC093065 TaxID=3366021 RepID=UPI0038062FD7